MQAAVGLVSVCMAVLVCVVLAAVALLVLNKDDDKNGSSGGSTGAAIGGNFPNKVFAPYWDVSNTAISWKACPAKYITLAFVLGDSSGTPMWGGNEPISSRVSLVNSIRAAGKDVIVSFGGQAGTELGQVVTSVDKLASAYQSVVDTLRLKWADFDIEGSSVADTQAATRRHKAIAKLQKARPNLIVSYTLPVMPDGLTQNEVKFLKLAKENGLRLDVVNIMTMDYSDSLKGDMGAYAISAATKTHSQLQQIGYGSTKVGITPMIGVNDIRSEVFTVANARAVRDFAQKTGWVRWLAFWSINRDNSSNKPNELYSSSGIKQSDWEFSREFAKYT